MLNVDSQEQLFTVLSNGGLALLPTDTIWGVGCDATNPDAIEKIYTLKKRPKDKPLVVLVDSVEMLKQYVGKVHPKVQTLLEYHVRPLTVIYDRGINLAPNLMGGGESVGIRIVLEPFCRSIISKFGKPIVATSANISGEPFPKNFGEISSDILEGVDYVVMVNQKDKKESMPSPIVKLDGDGELLFIRE